MDKIFQISRPVKRIISVLVDSLFIVVAFWLAMLIRLGFDIQQSAGYWFLLVLVIVVTVFVNINLGLYRAVIRFLGPVALAAVCGSVVISSIVVAVAGLSMPVDLPRSVPFIYACFLLLFVGGSRLAVRYMARRPMRKQQENVIIYGAGASGIQLNNALRNSLEYQCIAFIDDDVMLHRLHINGVKVYPQAELAKLIERYGVNKVLLAVPSASQSQRAVILNKLEEFRIEMQAIPAMADLVSGKAKIDDLVEVSVEDLLGRDPVPPNVELMHADIKNKVVMVTGAGGSIGSELCRQIINQQPQTLILFELTEFALYSIHRELEVFIKEQGLTVDLYPLLGSVTEQSRLQKVMSSFAVNTVYHAAAYKHVPLVEYNVIEGVQNNVFGTLRCAQAAIDAGVETFVLISTDKAVRPTNVMGTTKRMAELCLQALSAKGGHHTRFCMVRFGNVLGSSGSVVPLFKKQIGQGGPITLTHKDITRYFMTIPEAAQLVIQAGAMGMGGDVFVLDMGDPVKIYDLAHKMVHLSGLRLKHEGNPNGDIEIIETGLRPGEKLYEELLIGDDVEVTGNERIMTAHEIFLPWQELQPLLMQLNDACQTFDQQTIRQLLLSAPTAFTPADDICDLLYHQSHLNEVPAKAINS
ncbi:polysaccharide biosynthesis protein [Thalassotalea maritima]|uniref:polysaccharide biosynthesis protein n=1 Tax=Thalassotalea maritima TaxID=3242416 RepID=UPI0035272737